MVSFSAASPTTLSAKQQTSLISNIGSNLDNVELNVNGVTYNAGDPVAYITDTDGTVKTGNKGFGW